jgi:DNA-binding MarR family transcriptional regulator
VTAVKGGPPPDHLALRLRLALLRMRADVAAIAPARDTVDLTASHFRLLDRLPPAGARVTEVAQRMRITKQALGQLARQLADRGYVRIEPDPDDRRAKVVRCTRHGEASRAALRAAMAAVEDRWRAEVGPERFALFREVLDELTQHLVDAGRAGARTEEDEPMDSADPEADLTGERRP